MIRRLSLEKWFNCYFIEWCDYLANERNIVIKIQCAHCSRHQFCCEKKYTHLDPLSVLLNKFIEGHLISNSHEYDNNSYNTFDDDCLFIECMYLNFYFLFSISFFFCFLRIAVFYSFFLFFFTSCSNKISILIILFYFHFYRTFVLSSLSREKVGLYFVFTFHFLLYKKNSRQKSSHWKKFKTENSGIIPIEFKFCVMLKKNTCKLEKLCSTYIWYIWVQWLDIRWRTNSLYWFPKDDFNNDVLVSKYLELFFLLSMLAKLRFVFEF